jgi:gamma-glutamyltranspeptidase/glutathione hydrolase
MKRALALLIVGSVLVAGAAQAQQAAPVHDSSLHNKRDEVAAANPLAAEAGREMLRRGGTAVDAAIATQMVLNLVEPESSGIGGGALLVLYAAKDHRVTTFDGRETAPAAAKGDRFIDPNGKPMNYFSALIGGRSVGVPGVLRMLELAHRQHGKLPWRELFEPAIRLAETGIAASPRLRTQLQRDKFLRLDAGARKIYYDPSGRIVNPEYAKTLRAIAEGGADAFYRGPIAADIVRAVRSHARPGAMTEADLAGYRALERDALCGPYRIWVVCSMPPPSAGGVALLQILGILERKDFARAPPQSVDSLHLLAEAERLAYADRARYLGDADFVPVPVGSLLAPRYLDARAALVTERALPLAAPGSFESGTSHVVIADAQGNVVSMTTTIESLFGSRILVRGFLLNNQLTDFDFVPGGANEPRGGKRPRSSTTPVIVFGADGGVRLAAGSAGGSMIISYVAKTVVAALDWNLDMQAAVAAPNLGNRAGPTEIEQGSAWEALAPALRARGHEVILRELQSGTQGIERVAGGWRGGADPRRDGAVRGE